MPAVSKRQLKYIYVLRSKYKNKSSTPKKDQWIWKDEWTDVDYDTLKESQSYRVPSLQKELLDRFPGLHSLKLLENDFNLELSVIIIKPAYQKKGLLTTIMNRIIEYANTNNLIISLYPSDEYGVPKETLVNAYSKFGFKFNRKPIDKRFDKDNMLKHPDIKVFESFSEFTKIKPERGIKLFDLDDTLVITDAKIRVTDKDKTYELSPFEYTQFDTSNKELDFSDFTNPDILASGRIIKKTMDILKKSYPKMAIGIVTARSNKFLIKNFLLRQGVNIHLDLIYAVTDIDFVKKYGTRNVPMLKKFAVQELIERGFVDIEFYDDDKKNLKNVESLRTNGVKIKTHLMV